MNCENRIKYLAASHVFNCNDGQAPEHGLLKFLQSRLQVVYNKMIGYVLIYSIRTHLGANDFNEVKGLSCEIRVKYLVASHVFNCNDGQAPEYLLIFERVIESFH